MISHASGMWKVTYCEPTLPNAERGARYAESSKVLPRSAFRVRHAADLTKVGVLGDDPQRRLLTAAPDHNRRPGRRDGRRIVVSVLHLVVLAGEAGRAAG